MSQQQQYGLTFRAVSERAYTRRHHLPGSAASPTFAFDDARGTGFFLANVDTGMMGVAVNGEQKMLLDSNTITFDGDIEITGNLVTGEGNVALDFGNIGQSLVPAEDVTYDLGAPGRAWRQLYVDEIQVANLLDESGNAYNNLDLTAVETDILPVDASTLDIGSATKPWRTVVADNVDASNVSVSNDISVDGSATINGDVSLGSNVSIGNDISVGGSIDVGGLVIDANFQQDLITIIETGNVDLDLSNVGSDILPSDDATYAIGSAGKTWTELHVGEVAAATATIAGLATAASGNVLGDLAVGGDTSITGDVSAATATIGTSVEIAGETVATDGQGFTFTNDLLPVANMSSSLGTVQKWWERVYAQEVQTNQLTAENISVTGNLLVELGELIANSNVQLDLSNTSTDIIAVSNVYDLGSEGAPWGKLWVEEAHVSKFTDTNELRVGTDGVSTDLVPSTGALALGSVPSPWSAIYADELTAGDVAVNNNLAVSGNAVFDQDISVGGTIDVGGLVIDANFQQDLITIIETGNVDLDLSNVGSDILPSDDATYAIGSAGTTWTELHVGEVFASNVRVSNDISVD
ncbi:MAG: hypothetical protein GY704_09890, partial [Phycisphaeraceae bacterium]|nr:hypothetical protein [Phycisphaeraceae bacterium]